MTVIETRFGRIEGEARSGLQVFRGIPYAAPPVGPLRMRPPAPPKPWAGVREALRFGPVAPQNHGIIAALLGGGSEEQSEDCLTLNVWTPAADGTRRPVLVWIHGGGFTAGSGSMPLFDGARLARGGDVVVVTLNYRLGALGFLALPALEEDGGGFGNLGLLDQLAALEWVRDHAPALGGDPGRITVFGESAGAMSLGTLLGVPRARGLFQRAILQSGAASNVSSRAEAAALGERFMEELGLAADDLAGLRAAPVEDVLAAQARTSAVAGNRACALPFQPVVDGDVLPAPPLEAVRAGSAPVVPILIGTNLDECRAWSLTDRKIASLDEEGLLRRCERNLPGRDASGRPRAERVVAAYRNGSVRDGGALPDARDLWHAIESDRWFRVPALRLAEAVARRETAAYAYLFTWASPALEGRLGACHALDVPFVFGGVRDPRVALFVGDPAAAEPLSRAVRAAWVAFARSGDPSHPGMPAWPAYEPGRRATMLLGETCRVEEAPYEAERAVWDEVD